MSVADHFSLVAPAYDSLRTTDEAPVRRIRQLLPDRPVTGLDIGCGTGRYSRLLRGLLPDGSLLVASDVSAAMLAELKAGADGHAVRVVPLRSTAEELPLRTASLDLVTAFNCVHHFDLGRFLTAVARVLQPDGQLFIYTRTPQQNARTIWGRYFPGFTEHEQRLHSEAAFRDAVRRTAGLTVVATQTFRHPALEHGRTAQGPGRGPPLLDLLPLPAGRAARVPSRPSWPACPAPRSPGSTSTSWSSPAVAGGTGGGGRSSRRPPPQSRLQRRARSPHRPGRHDSPADPNSTGTTQSIGAGATLDAFGVRH